MDLSESMKMALSKGGSGGDQSARGAGAGYVTEKLYMLLQLYLQNKGWSPSVELLQCFQELKDSPVLPSPAYLQVIANRVNLDSQGRLILRENGKIVLPYEHFGNAVMLKHMQGGPHGPHLSVEQTVRAVMESYTIGRENFGMEKEFIIDVVKSCPNCRYYKSHMPGFMDQPFPATAAAAANQLNADYMAHLQQIAAAGIDISALDPNGSSPQNLNPKLSKSSNSSRMDSQQAQITAAIIQQQNRAIAQQNLDKNFVNMFPLEKQRLLQHYEKHQQQQQQAFEKQQHAYEKQQAYEKQHQYEKQQQQQLEKLHQQHHHQQGQGHYEKPHPIITASLSNNSGASSSCHNLSASSSSNSNHNLHQSSHPPPPPLQTVLPTPPRCATPATPHETKVPDYYRSNLEAALDGGGTNKDLLALHNGAWPSPPAPPTPDTRSDGTVIGQEKIVRTFAELIHKMNQMKQFIRPTMCESVSGL